MKYKKSFLIEVKRFDECGRLPVSGPATDIGLEQFYRFESYGEIPENPDPYYELLVNGKKWWEWTLNTIAATYYTTDWWGWHQLALDYIYDPAAFKQLRQRVGFKPINPQEYLDEVERSLNAF